MIVVVGGNSLFKTASLGDHDGVDLAEATIRLPSRGHNSKPRCEIGQNQTARETIRDRGCELGHDVDLFDTSVVADLPRLQVEPLDVPSFVHVNTYIMLHTKLNAVTLLFIVQGTSKLPAI